MAKNGGFEPKDDRKLAVPVKFRSAPGEVDRLRAMMASVVQDLRNRDDVESFEESLDFEVDDDDSPPLSNSETRYMQEENLLTEAREASRVVEQRRAADNWRNRNGKRDRSGKSAGDESGSEGSRGDRKESGSERGSGGRERSNARSGADGAGGNSEPASKAGHGGD